jgi:DeoR/GlpR family transcriptional regulator of sugar metabolism
MNRPRPLPRQRVDRLRALVLDRGGVTVAEAARLFDVSPMTARRDLAEVTRTTSGVVRVHGGAVHTRWPGAISSVAGLRGAG